MFSVIYDPVETTHEPKFYVRSGRICSGFERTGRAATLLDAFKRANWPIRGADDFGLGAILKVHSKRYASFLQRASAHLELGADADAELVPTITRKNTAAMKYPAALAGQVEWHMYDVFSPIGPNTYAAALGAANVALTAAESLRGGARAAYALCRPPGHHAHADYGGGYCYLNNAAIAAQALSCEGNRVAILDVDADHGNGTQDIFYEREDVFHVSLHADPSDSYPFFTGYEEERGRGAGFGANVNITLSRGTGDEIYLAALSRALETLSRFDPHYLVVALGVDGHVDEPNQLFRLTTDCYHKIGAALFEVGLPTLFTQEGGYNRETLAANVLAVTAPFAQAGRDAGAMKNLPAFEESAGFLRGMGGAG